MASEESAEDIRRRMAELRRELTFDVHEVSRNARVMTDWKFYVRRFPWAVAGVAAVAGFMLIPRKKHVQVIAPDPDALAEMFRKEKLRVETPAPNKESQGLTKTLLLMGLSWAAKTGMNYMGERVRTAAAGKARESAEQQPVTAQRGPQTWPK
jgi:hypothetical protein